MAKRFSDSNKWSKPFIRSMKAPYKLLWLFILDECDHAGLWQVDFDTAQIKTGEKLDKEQAAKLFSDKIIEVDSGEKWFIVDFIDFQYGQLQANNRVHVSVANILRKYDLIDESLCLKKVENKGLTTPLQGCKDKDKDKAMDKDKDNMGVKNKKSTKHSFEDSEYFDKAVFAQMLQSSSEPYCKADPNHYWESCKNGSDSKGYKYLNWSAAIKTWIRTDIHEGKFKSIKTQAKVEENPW